jgi:hypothetical protein
MVNTINYLPKAVSINRGTELPALSGEISWPSNCAGFPEKCTYYYQVKLKLEDDSLSYYSSLAGLENNLSNFKNLSNMGYRFLRWIKALWA